MVTDETVQRALELVAKGGRELRIFLREAEKS